MSDLKKEVVADWLDSFRREYSELVDVWKGLDIKAQGTIGICGVFLAGILAFVRNLHNLKLSNFDKWTFTISVFLIVVSIVLALISLYTRTVSMGPNGEAIEEYVTDLVDGTEVSSDVCIAYMWELSEHWKETNDELSEVNDTKSHWLKAAQIVLTVSVLAMAFLSINQIWK